MSGGQYISCHPPGCEAHGLKVGSAHGGGTTAPCTISRTVTKTAYPDLIPIFVFSLQKYYNRVYLILILILGLSCMYYSTVKLLYDATSSARSSLNKRVYVLPKSDWNDASWMRLSFCKHFADCRNVVRIETAVPTKIAQISALSGRIWTRNLSRATLLLHSANKPPRTREIAGSNPTGKSRDLCIFRRYMYTVIFLKWNITLTAWR